MERLIQSPFRRTFSPVCFFSFRLGLPFIPALCVLSLSLSSVRPASSFRLGCAQSNPLIPLIRSKFARQHTERSDHSVAMEGNSNDLVPCIVVYVTVPNKEAGKKLAESIIKEKLAACVNIVPGIHSFYYWDNQVQSDAEELLIIKTRKSLLENLTEHVKVNHEYELPEVISMDITGGNPKYLEWVKNSAQAP